MNNQGANVETRPWGWFEILATGPGHLVKRLTIRPGQETSLQFHNHRAEHIVVAEGTARVILGDKEVIHTFTYGHGCTIQRGAVHRLQNAGMGTLVIIETWTGTDLREDDIVRLEDRYGRVDTV